MVSLRDFRPYYPDMGTLILVAALIAWYVCIRPIARYLHQDVFKNPLNEKRTYNILKFTPIVLLILLDVFNVFSWWMLLLDDFGVFD